MFRQREKLIGCVFSYFVNSGTEANELAMLMARLCSGSFGMIDLRNAYHGGSDNTIGITTLKSQHMEISNSSGLSSHVFEFSLEIILIFSISTFLLQMDVFSLKFYS